jgi:hypothetical protein
MPATSTGTDSVGRVAEGVLGWWGGWLPAFVLTCVIELPVYLVMFELFGLIGTTAAGEQPLLTRGRALTLALVVNLVTHPAFWWAAQRMDGTVEVLVGELVVVGVEGLLVFAVLRRRPLVCWLSALLANAASAVLGSAILAAVISSAAASASTMSTWPG